jgi:hypothetical protein
MPPLQVWVGHSCPTFSTLVLKLPFGVDVAVASVGRTLLSDAFDVGVEVAPADPHRALSHTHCHSEPGAKPGESLP